MALHPGGLSSYSFTYDNWGTNPASTLGTSVIPGATNVEGSWTQVASSANIAFDCYWIYMLVHSGATSTALKGHLLDIGVDPAGGTAYSAIISNLQVGSAPSLTQAGNREFVFPFFIKAGSSVAIRIQGENATAGTVRVPVRFYGNPSRPEVVPVGAISQTFGDVEATSRGTAFTPGNAANGSWVSLGTTSTPLWWWQMGYAVGDTTSSAEYTYIEVAWGDASNKHVMFKVMHGGTTAETCGLAAQTQMLMCAAYNHVPAGVNIYVRGRCNNAPDTNYHANVIGIGG